MDTLPSSLETHPGIPVLYRALSLNTTLAMEGLAKAPAYGEIPELTMSVDELCRRLRTDKTRGLSTEIVRQRLLDDGANVLIPPRANYFRKFVAYFFSGFNILMLIAAALVFVVWRLQAGERATDFQLGLGVILLMIVAISALFYAFIDLKATRTMASIQSLVANTVTVIRDGEVVTTNAETLVRGDLVCLKQGQRVPADLRLIQVSFDARFDRSILTGESEVVAGSVDATSLNPFESKNMGLSSTFLVRGNARGIVIGIGNDTIIGNILKMSIAGKTKVTLSPIQKDISYFTITISIVAVAFFLLAILVWGAWIERNYPAADSASTAIINAIGCLIAFVPQGLPICFALALAIIARRMVRQNVLVKNLNMVETLGCISVLCSDKTGTLTLGKMAVHSILFVDAVLPLRQARLPSDAQQKAAVADVLRIARLCNDAEFAAGTDHLPVPERPVRGDATDSAILSFAATNLAAFPDAVRFSLAFNARNKFMAKIVESEGGILSLLVKGAPDILMKSSTFVMESDGAVVDFDPGRRKAIGDIQDQASRQGHRLIALCQKRLDRDAVPMGQQDALEAFAMDQIRHDLTMVAILVLTDPPRADVPDTVLRMRRAGIRVVMITGDFELTACSIASSVGILTVPEHRIARIANLQELRLSDPLPHAVLAPNLRPAFYAAPRAIVINGWEVEKLFQDDWDFILTKFNELVFSRTSPEQKLIIVENLKDRGDNFVAVTGDGTNDAPALKAAHVGVSMGSGSDIAKEAATIILLNNTFASLLVAIENGRLVFENLKKVLLFLMTAGAFAEFIAVASSAFLGMQIPLSGFQQVMFCMTNDLIMSISLMYERPEADLMNRPPRNARTDRLTDWRFFIQLFVIIGPLICISSMGMWFLYLSTQGVAFSDLFFVFNGWKPSLRGDTPSPMVDIIIVGQCIYFVTMAICQIGTLFAVRTRIMSLFVTNPLWGPHQNLFIFFAIVCNIAICLVIFYGYWIQVIFWTAPIPVNFWFIPFAGMAAIVVVDEVRKYVVRNYPRSFMAKIAW